MKKILLSIIAAAMVAAVPVSLNAGWMKTYGWEGYESGECLQITSDNGYIVAGYADEGIWVLKMDQQGDTIWTLRYDAKFGYSVRETNDGGYIVTGMSSGNGDVVLLKLDSDGNVNWVKFYGEEDGTEWGKCVRQTSDGGYIITGMSVREGLLLLKTDAIGDMSWLHYYAGANSQGYCVELTPDNGYIVTGHVDGCLWLFETDVNGDTIWTRRYRGETGEESGRCVRSTRDNGYIVVGHAASFGSGYTDPWLVKTDSLGNTLWTNVFESEGIGFNEANCVQQTVDGGYIIAAGKQYGSTGDVDAWLIKTDEKGDTLWTRLWGMGDGMGDIDRIKYLQQTEDGGYIITGSTSSWGAGSSDLWMIKTDSLGYVGVEENPIEDITNLKVVNPVGPHITLRYANHPQGFRAAIFDASGRKVDELHAPLPSGTISWGKGFGQGVYFIRDMSSASGTVHKVVLTK